MSSLLVLVALGFMSIDSGWMRLAGEAAGVAGVLAGLWITRPAKPTSSTCPTGLYQDTLGLLRSSSVLGALEAYAADSASRAEWRRLMAGAPDGRDADAPSLSDARREITAHNRRLVLRALAALGMLFASGLLTISLAGYLSAAVGVGRVSAWGVVLNEAGGLQLIFCAAVGLPVMAGRLLRWYRSYAPVTVAQAKRLRDLRNRSSAAVDTYLGGVRAQGRELLLGELCLLQRAHAAAKKGDSREH